MPIFFNIPSNSTLQFLHTLLRPCTLVIPTTILCTQWFHGSFLSTGSTLCLHHYADQALSDTLYNKLDPVPPWNNDHVAMQYFPRHYRKHGCYRFCPRHPVLRRDHIWLCIQLLLLGPPCFMPSAAVAMKLRHTCWSHQTQDQWSLPYFDIDVSSFGHSEPSSIMKIFQWTPPPPVDLPNDGFASPPSQPVFQLDEVCLDNIYTSNQDPSDIMQIYHFNNILTQTDLPVLFSILEQPSAYNVRDLHTPPPLIVDTGASACITPLRSDFVKYHNSSMVVHRLSSSNVVTGEGLINWHAIGTDGNQSSVWLKRE